MMTSSMVPNSVARILDLVRQLSPEERRVLLDNLLLERFDNVLSKADQHRGSRTGLTDEEIQAEVDEIRRQRREDRRRAVSS